MGTIIAHARRSSACFSEEDVDGLLRNSRHCRTALC